MKRNLDKDEVGVPDNKDKVTQTLKRVEEIIENYSEVTTEWEDNFLESIQIRLQKGIPLSEAQEESFVKIDEGVENRNSCMDSSYYDKESYYDAY